ncbi:hypothetical protein GF324_05125 [bacterium]|nr:hypothetical protein [bacterium]
MRRPMVVFRGRAGVLFSIPLKNVSDTRMGMLAEEVKALVSRSLSKQDEDDVENLESKGKTYPGARDGAVLHDLLYVFLPILTGAVIVAISIFIAVRQENPTRLMIPELKLVLMLITGYYLGMGVANIRNRIDGEIA